MNKSLTILRHEFLRTLKSKSFIILTVALPVLVILGLGVYQGISYLYKPTTEVMNTGYVDQTGLFSNYTVQDGGTLIAYNSEDEAKTALLDNGITDLFVIPSDYLATGQVIRYTLSRDYELPAATVSQMKSFLLSNLLDSSVSPEIIERVKDPFFMNSIRLDDTGEIAPGQDIVSMIVVPLVFAIIFMISVFFASGFLFQSVTEEKENRIIEILLSSVSSWQLLVGKILGLGLAGLLQVAVWLATVVVFAALAPGLIPALSGLSIPISLIGWALLYFILGYLLFASIYAGVGSVGPSAKESQSLSMIFVIPAIIPYYFSYFVVTQPESVFSRILTLFPLTSPMTVMMRLPSHSIAGWELALSLIILAGSVVFGIWFASRIFRVFLLMYGKKISPRDIFKYLKNA
ncbi:MAG: ABC transporter permease [Dehalococcoidales bacterium]|nr:ABC transporter permease [Dehalococcoidales bacterium]